MKIISFGAVEILPALLDKSKTQTIRPAWKNIPDPDVKDAANYVLKGQQLFTGAKTFYILRKPRFSVGEEVKLVWKQRSRYKWFHWSGDTKESCNAGFMTRKEALAWTHNKKGLPPVNSQGESNDCLVFPKLLGYGEITEVFEIEMGINDPPDIINDYWVKKTKKTDTRPEWKKFDYTPIVFGDKRDLAIRDGFKSPQKMGDWFDKAYDLSTPKKFHVYRWKWL
ncbi:hypothetical protein ACFL6S_03505 [Candidatus Poribacteria bacterium]